MFPLGGGGLWNLIASRGIWKKYSAWMSGKCPPPLNFHLPPQDHYTAINFFLQTGKWMLWTWHKVLLKPLLVGSIGSRVCCLKQLKLYIFLEKSIHEYDEMLFVWPHFMNQISIAQGLHFRYMLIRLCMLQVFMEEWTTAGIPVKKYRRNGSSTTSKSQRG